MKIIQTHPTFYVELSPDEILICPKQGVCSVFPVWLGKNRAIMRDAISYFEKHPPETFVECLEIISRFELNGIGSTRKKIPELFVEQEKTIDKEKVFW